MDGAKNRITSACFGQISAALQFSANAGVKCKT
jgi:hypothetical protein